MKNIVIKFKTGFVGMAHNLDGEIETRKFEQEELGFAVGKQTPDTGIPNTFWALDSILKQVETLIEKQPNERVQIAVPGTVFAVVNSVEMLTKLMWTRKMIYNTATDQKSRRTILLHRKAAEQYTLSDREYMAYKNLFMHVRKLMGYVLFVDSSFINAREENAKTPEQITWFNLNQTVNSLMSINTGSQSPYANVATGTDGPDGGSAIDEDDDLPF